MCPFYGRGAINTPLFPSPPQYHNIEESYPMPRIIRNFVSTLQIDSGVDSDIIVMWSSNRTFSPFQNDLACKSSIGEYYHYNPSNDF
jgi:hypothetical protein